MCLIKYNPGFKIAREDILVYKLLYKEESNETYYSIYRNSPYELGIVYRVSSLVDQPIQDINHYPKYRVEAGLHSFTTLEYAKIMRWNATKQVIALGIVPKGSRYAYGNDNDIVSNELKLIRIICA